MIISKLGIWRGMPFRYRDVGQSNEANLEIIRYAGGDWYDVVENGRSPSPIRCQIVFTGPTAEVEKLGFLKLCEMKGPGTLIHPDFGIFQAYCRSWPETSNGAEQGIYFVDVEFLPVLKVPGSDIAFVAVLSASNLVMLAAAAAEFAANQPDPADSAAAVAMAAANLEASQELAVMSALVTPSKQDLLNIALNAAGVADADGTVDAWAAVAAQVDEPEAARAGLAAVVDGWQSAINLQATDYTKGIAITSMYEYVSAALIARYAALTLAKKWDTFNDAADAAAIMYSEMGAAIEMMTGNGIIRGALQVRGAVYSGVIVDALKLPKRIDYESKSVISSVELAFRLYGDMDRADEIDADNDTVHPGFVPTGILRVLTA